MTVIKPAEVAITILKNSGSILLLRRIAYRPEIAESPSQITEAKSVKLKNLSKGKFKKSTGRHCDTRSLVRKYQAQSPAKTSIKKSTGTKTAVNISSDFFNCLLIFFFYILQTKNQTPISNKIYDCLSSLATTSDPVVVFESSAGRPSSTKTINM